jgi:hypothetical protein
MELSMRLARVLFLLLSALRTAGGQVGTAPERLMWLHRDDLVRITSTSPPLDGAVSMFVDRTANGLIVSRRRFHENTYDGVIAVESIQRLEVGRRDIEVATWRPLLTALAGAAIAGGSTWSLTCAVHPCHGPEGLGTIFMGVLGAAAGSMFGQWYFNRGKIRWTPVMLPSLELAAPFSFGHVYGR